MKKQFTILLILFFVFGFSKDVKAFVDPIPNCTADDFTCTEWSPCINGNQTRQCSKISNCFGDQEMPAVSTSYCIITNENLYPKITSVSPTTVRKGETIEIIGENFENAAYIPVGSPFCFNAPVYSCGELISFSNTKMLVKIGNNTNTGLNGVRLIFKNISGGLGSSNSQSFTIKEDCKTGDDWNCTGWGSCSELGIHTKTCVKSGECESLNTPMPDITGSCTYIPPCTLDNYECTEWSSCSILYNKQTRQCSKKTNCVGGVSEPPTSQSCTYTPPIPTCLTYLTSIWSDCRPDGTQTRSITGKYPNNCEGGELPQTTQFCTYTSPCTADTWTCDSWGACSLSGIQSRNCSKTFDCPSVQTAPPITDQYCEVSNKPQQTAPSESDEITNQDTIIKATVKLLCPVDEQKASQGSGTVIDSAGTILTNKHVIAGTLGCLVGFIDNFSDEPYFGDRQIADIVKVSSNQDIAVLKIRNPKNKALPYVNTTNGNVNFALGTKITTYGYPAKFGTKVTYTSGDFSGNDGGYLKTTAILEYGNSGGGAYLKNGTYIGIPSAVVKGELNAMGYILSINTIRAYLNNSSVASGNTNNNYSRVSVLEDIDLKKLGSLKLFIPNVDKNSNLITSATNQNSQKTTVQPQQESVVIESNNLNKDNTSSIQNASSTPEQHPKISLIKRFFLWLSNLFNKLATR